MADLPKGKYVQPGTLRSDPLTPAEPTNEALIEDYERKRDLASASYGVGANEARQVARIARETLRTRLATLTERAEKSEATMERLGLVEDVTFDAADNSVSEWKNIRAEAAEAELARTREALTGIRGKAADLVHFYASTTAKEIAQLATAALAKKEPAHE